MSRYALLAVVLFPSLVLAQSEEPVSEFPGLKLELVLAERSFEIGTTIDVVMRYTYTGDEPKLGVWHIGYDRSGRVPEYGFTATDADGKAVVDPIEGRQGGFGGGGRTSGPLNADEPYEQTVTVNEWLRFDRPGKYRIVGHSEIVCPDIEESGSAEGYPIRLKSGPVEIEILPADEAGRRARIEEAREQLASEDDEVRHLAARELRFMVDERVIPLLVGGLTDPSGNVVVEARFGLLSFADLSPVRVAIAKLLKEGFKVPAEDVFMYAELLALADVQAAGITGGWDSDEWSDAYHEHLSRWKTAIGSKLKRDVENLPPTEAVKTLIDGMALGALYPRGDEKLWKFIFRHLPTIEEGIVVSRAEHLIANLRLETLIPDLKRAVEDKSVDGRLRSAAIWALHEMGEDPYRDLIAEDLVSESPIMTPIVHGTLGDYRAEEIGEKLLARFHAAEGSSRSGQAGRIRDFGGAIPPEKLLEALNVADGGRDGRFALLTALAVKSSAHAMPLLTKFFEKPRRWRASTQWHHLRILTGTDTPGAQELLRDLLLAHEVDDRVDTIQQLGQTYREYVQASDPHRALPSDIHRPRRPPACLAPRFFPELLLLFKGDPAAEVRIAAQRLLVQVTGIPEEGAWGETWEGAQEWVQGWERWWEENGARFGRWGRVRHGIAMRVTLPKGVFDGGEPIPASVTFRRMAGDRPLPGKVRFRVAFLPQGRLEEDVYPSPEPLPLPKALKLPQEAGREVRGDIDLRKVGIFDKPGRYRVHVRTALIGPSQKTNWSEREVVIAHPVTFVIR